MTQSEIVSWCQSYVADVLAMTAQQIDPDANVSDLGFDSSAAVSMVLDLELKLERELDPAILFEYPTLRALGDALGRENAPQPGPS
jgi:acyl carrier protein